MCAKLLRPSLMALALLLVTVFPALAADLTVTNTNDSGPGSLRQAVADADPGASNTINFADGITGTITFGSTIVIDKDISIVGPGVDWMQLSGNTFYRVFQVASGKTVSISGMKIIQGAVTNESGGGIYNDGMLTVSHCSISSNTATGTSDVGGAGVFNSANGNLVVDDTSFVQNYADTPWPHDPNQGYLVFGGGIYSKGALTVTNSKFYYNYSYQYRGGAIAVEGYGNPAVKIEGCYFEGNFAKDGGGAILLSDGNMTVSRCTFLLNQASGLDNSYGGAIYNIYGNLSVMNSWFGRNMASGVASKGAGIYSYGDLSATNCTFSDNASASEGGAITVYWFTAAIKNCIFWGNYAQTAGTKNMSLEADAGTLNVANCDVEGGLPAASSVVDGGGNIDADPQFAHPIDGGNYIYGDRHLLSTSPCIDKGDDGALPLDATTDLDGNARTVGAHVDMGCYEAAVIAPPDTTPPTIDWGTPVQTISADGWYNGWVGLPYTVNDSESGVSPGTPSGMLYFNNEGANQTQDVTVFDNAGNSATYTSLPAINIDWTVPTTVLSAAGTAVTLTASDLLSGVKTTYYQVDGGATQTYSGPFNVPAGGLHNVTSWSVDRADNAETAHTDQVDTRAAVTVKVSNASGRRGGKVTLQAAVTQTSNAAKLSNLAVTFTVDNVFVGNAIASRGVAKISYTIPSGMTVGAHTILAVSQPNGTFKSGSGAGTLTVK